MYKLNSFLIGKQNRSNRKTPNRMHLQVLPQPGAAKRPTGNLSLKIGSSALNTKEISRLQWIPMLPHERKFCRTETQNCQNKQII